MPLESGLHHALKGTRVVLLDIDGTLIDSNQGHANAWSDALKDEGFVVAPDRLLSLIGMGADKLLPIAIGQGHESEVGERLAKAQLEIFRERYLPSVHAFPGTRQMCEQLARTHELVIATSADESLLGELLDKAGVADLLSHRTTSSDAKNSKPDPDILQAALAKAKCDPGQAIFIGDTPYDLEASHRSKVAFIAFRSGGWDDKAFAGAKFIFDGPADLFDALTA